VALGRAEAHLGPAGGRGWGKGVAGVGVRRRPAAVAAAARSPVSRRLGVDNARPWGALDPREDARGAGWKGDGRRRRRSGGGGNSETRRGWRLGMAWGRREHGALLYARARVTAG
jgi:hypothetical protein